MKKLPKSITDKELIKGIALGDPEVMGYLYQAYFPRIERFITSNSGDIDDAMDIFQDAVMVVYQKFKNPEASLTSSFFTFLYAVCRNLWLKELKKRKDKGVTTSLESVSIGVEEIESAIFNRDKISLFRSKFTKLGQGCQDILKLFFDGKSMKEIASIMNISEKYARKRKFQCKEKLTALVKADPLYNELKHHGE
ncbi:MAG: sigma-70 family RNA polymerase sigma factor [Bacteroidota bacterium]